MKYLGVCSDSAADAEKHRKRLRKWWSGKRNVLLAVGGVAPDGAAPLPAATDTDSTDGGGVTVPADEDALCATSPTPAPWR